MKRGSVVILQMIVILIGIGALAFMLWEPLVEGRNAHATFVDIYFRDPFLAFAYVGSIPFFVALYQALKALRYAGSKNKFAPGSANALRTIRYCAFVIIGFVVVGELFIMISDSDDRAGGAFMGILITLGSIAVAFAAAAFERRLQNTVEMRPTSGK